MSNSQQPDREKGVFVMSIKVMSMVFDANGLTATQKLVMLSLSDHGAEDGSRIYPSVETTTEKTGLSERQVRRTLADLRKIGLISVVRKAGQHRATEYAISIKTLKSMDFRPDTVAPLEESRPATQSARPDRVAPNPLETPKESEPLHAPKPRAVNLEVAEAERLITVYLEVMGTTLPKTLSQSAITKLWRNPMREIIALANGQSEWLIKRTISYMRENKPNALTIKNPNSLLGCAPDVWSKYRPEPETAYVDPMQPYWDWMSKKESENGAQNADA